MTNLEKLGYANIPVDEVAVTILLNRIREDIKICDFKRRCSFPYYEGYYKCVKNYLNSEAEE